jgi:hypothetical protein
VTSSRSDETPVETTPVETTPDSPPSRRHWRLAGLLVVPYLLLSLSWALSNPPAAAPDETLHIIKALGNGDFQFGKAGPPVPDEPTLENRNNSTIRIYDVPSRLVPKPGVTCFAYSTDITADCQPNALPKDVGDVEVPTEVGAYPPFAYVPIGLAAHLGSTPAQAFILGRIAVSLLSAGLLLVGTAHLIRWLGRGAILGTVAAMTPVAVFISGSLNPSGIEITSALAVSSLVTVAVLRPESVNVPATHWTLMGVGIVLALSRQLGALVLAALLILMLVSLGWSRVRRLLVSRQPSFIIASIGLVAAGALTGWYELTYDHPAGSGTVLEPRAVEPFLTNMYALMNSGIGLFGWLDTPAPRPLVALWVAMWVLLLCGALLLGRRREVWTLLAAFAGVWILAFCVYASGYYPLGVFGQGRHLLPAAMFVLVFSGAVFAERLSDLSVTAARRVFAVVAVFVGVSQAASIYWNGRRYAVGRGGDVWFFPDALWQPKLGWAPWFVLAAAAAVMLAVVILRSRPRAGTHLVSS